MFKVSKQNINLNIYYLGKLTAAFREWCGEYFISRYDKTWDLIFKSGVFEYSNNTSIISKGRGRISIVWVPPLGFDPYCESKCPPLEDKFTPSINSKKIFLQKLWTNFEKSQNLIFSKMAQPILMTKIYVIEGTKDSIIFLMWITSWTPTIFFLYHVQIQSDNIYFFENFRRRTS